MREQAFESEMGEVCYLWPMNKNFWDSWVAWVLVGVLFLFIILEAAQSGPQP